MVDPCEWPIGEDSAICGDDSDDYDSKTGKPLCRKHHIELGRWRRGSTNAATYDGEVRGNNMIEFLAELGAMLRGMKVRPSVPLSMTGSMNAYEPSSRRRVGCVNFNKL